MIPACVGSNPTSPATLQKHVRVHAFIFVVASCGATGYLKICSLRGQTNLPSNAAIPLQYRPLSIFSWRGAMAEFHIAKTVAEGRDLFLLGQMANRHGLIAGATGTGKTVTLRKMAESFSRTACRLPCRRERRPVRPVRCGQRLRQGGRAHGPNSVWTKRPIYKASPCAFGTCTAKAASPCA